MALQRCKTATPVTHTGRLRNTNRPFAHRKHAIYAPQTGGLGCATAAFGHRKRHGYAHKHRHQAEESRAYKGKVRKPFGLRTSMFHQPNGDALSSKCMCLDPQAARFPLQTAESCPKGGLATAWMAATCLRQRVSFQSHPCSFPRISRHSVRTVSAIPRRWRSGT